MHNHAITPTQSTAAIDSIKLVICRMRTERPYQGPSYDDLWTMLNGARLRPADIDESMESLRRLRCELIRAAMTEEMAAATRNFNTEFDPDEFAARLSRAGLTLEDVGTNARAFDRFRHRPKPSRNVTAPPHGMLHSANANIAAR